MFVGICLAVFFCLTNALAIRATDCNDRVTPTLPLTGGNFTVPPLCAAYTMLNYRTDATELPSANLTALSYIAIGRGVQNYTCTAAGSNSTAVGAIATLFDATELAYYNEDALHAIPPVVVYRPVPSASLHTGGSTLPVLGHHYFNAAGVPTFDLSTKSKIFYGAKTGDIKAPATADKGPAGTGAVDWLQ
jgi:hypothetical protein